MMQIVISSPKLDVRKTINALTTSGLFPRGGPEGGEEGNTFLYCRDRVSELQISSRGNISLFIPDNLGFERVVELLRSIEPLLLDESGSQTGGLVTSMQTMGGKRLNPPSTVVTSLGTIQGAVVLTSPAVVTGVVGFGTAIGTIAGEGVGTIVSDDRSVLVQTSLVVSTVVGTISAL